MGRVDSVISEPFKRTFITWKPGADLTAEGYAMSYKHLIFFIAPVKEESV